MNARLLRLDDEATPAQAAQVVQAGGLIIFPTDTVWGLGADTTSERAITRLRRLKGRSARQPLALHLANVELIQQYCRRLTRQQRRWIALLLPGPYTLILPAAPGAPPVAVNSAGGVGLRVPASRSFQQLAAALTCPLVGTSVNRSGQPPLTRLEEIIGLLGAEVELILTSDEPMSGQSSTVIELTGNSPQVLRGKLPQALRTEQR